MFSLDPVVALGGGIHLITGLSVDEHDFCNVASLVIKRKECVSAYSHIQVVIANQSITYLNHPDFWQAAAYNHKHLKNRI